MSDDDPQILTFGPRRRGRPTLSSEPSASVHLRLPESDYDLAYKMAAAQRVSVPELMRQAFRRLVDDERGGVFRYPK